MKKIICLLLVAILCLSLVGCGKDKREMFNVKFDDYLTLADYQSIEIDKTSKDFENYYNNIYENYISGAGAYDQIKEGKVKKGDTVNIDYEGKKDGKAFDGGTAKGQNLVIGSNSFIEGFESGLIGKEIGKTVDLKLTFPKDYSEKSLAGQKVVFTVKINYVQALPEKTDATAKKLGFENKEDLIKKLEENAAKNCIAQEVINNSSVKKYSEKDKEYYDKRYDEYIADAQAYTNQYNAQYGTNISLDEMLYYSVGGTASDIKTNFTKEMESYMILYAVLDKEGLIVDSTKIDETVKTMVNSSTSEAQVRENYDNQTLEMITVENMVIDHLFANVVKVK